MLRLFFVIQAFCLATSMAYAATPVSPLASYSTSWNAAVYLKANTARNATYFTTTEKELIYIANLVRMYPKQFATTVLAKYPAKSGKDHIATSAYYKSLMSTLLTLKPQGALVPDSLAWVSADCHANTSGSQGYDGHTRVSDTCEKLEHFDAECCHYGYEKALDILISLLIDEDIPSLGHRNILLGSFTKVGVAIRPHSVYGSNTVMDFLR